MLPRDDQSQWNAQCSAAAVVTGTLNISDTHDD